MTKPPKRIGLFRAFKVETPDHTEVMFGKDALPKQEKPAKRDPLDFDPTPPDATEAFLIQEADAIREHGSRVFESAVGMGHMARVLERFEFDVFGCDVVDRGWAGDFVQCSFFDFQSRPCSVTITNPPYNEVNASNGHGRWLRHCFDLGFPYIALLLNSDWAAARKNGFDELFEIHPPSVEYVCCWKIDFRGGGSPPQRNSWYVWDTHRAAVGPGAWIKRRLYRDSPDPRQGLLGFVDD